MPLPDPRSVFVVHGRNIDARDAVFTFLRAINLRPMEWTQAIALTGEGSPYVGTILDAAFANARAVVVLMTPDDIAHLRPDLASSEGDDADVQPAGQARPNVLFEAGLAMGRSADRTVLVECGDLRPFSDIGGRHTLRMNNSVERRQEFAQRLKTAGCDVELGGTDWHTAGNLDPATLRARPAIGRRLAEAPNTKRRIVLDAEYVHEGNSQGKLAIINRGTEPVKNVTIQWPPGEPGLSVIDRSLPIAVLPAGKFVRLPALRRLGGSTSTHVTLTLTGETEDGQAVSQEAFVSLL